MSVSRKVRPWAKQGGTTDVKHSPLTGILSWALFVAPEGQQNEIAPYGAMK
jgi:hypothetical protein